MKLLRASLTLALIMGLCFSIPTEAARNPSKDRQPPYVKYVSSPNTNRTYVTGETLRIDVFFSETVIVNGTPKLLLETGATDRWVSYVSGSGSSVVSFSYTVVSGDRSMDLNYQNTSALILNSGTIRDAGGNDAKLALPTFSSSYHLAAMKNLVVDTLTREPASSPSPSPSPSPSLACGGYPDLNFDLVSGDYQALTTLLRGDADKSVCLTGTADFIQSATEFSTVAPKLEFSGVKITGNAVIRGSIRVDGFRTLQSSDSAYARTPSDARTSVYIATLPTGLNYAALYKNAGESVWPTGKNAVYFMNHPVQIFHNGKRLKESSWPFDGSWARITQIASQNEITQTLPALPVLPSVTNQQGDNALWFDVIPKTYQQEMGQMPPSTTSIVLNKNTYTPLTPESASFHGGLVKIRNFGPEGFVPGQVRESVYWIDRNTGQIALYLVNEPLGEIRVTGLYNPLLTIDSDTVIDGLTFEHGLGNGIYITGSNNKLTNLTLRGFSDAAIQMSNVYQSPRAVPTHNEISYSRFYELDRQAISMQTTQTEHLRTLTSHGHKIHHNEIYNIQQFFLNPPAIELAGKTDSANNVYNRRLVGVEITDNSIHDIPGMAIWITGAKNQILRNFIDNVSYMLTDWGAIYSGRSLIAFGNVVSNNTIQNIKPRYDQGPINYPEGDTTAIYFDDGVSGVSATHNTMINVDRMSVLGGGSYLHFDNNQCTQCSKSIHWGKWGMPNIPFMKQMAADLCMDPIWAITYPGSQLYLDSAYDGSQTYDTTIQNNYFNGVLLPNQIWPDRIF